MSTCLVLFPPHKIGVLMLTIKPCFEVRNLNFFLGFLLLYNRRVSKILFSFYHTSVWEERWYYLCFMMEKHKSIRLLLCNVILQLTWDTACYFRSLKCSSHSHFLHLWMLKSCANQSCTDWPSGRESIREVGSDDFLASHRIFLAETEIKMLLCIVVMLIVRLFSFYSFSLVFYLSFARVTGLSWAGDESWPVAVMGIAIHSHVVTHMQYELSCWTDHTTVSEHQHLM